MEQTDSLIEAGRWLLAQGTEFKQGVVSLEALPDATRIEIAFAGRSNVGKSSLLNAVTGTKALARTSNTPGRTQELNFFLLAPARNDGAAWLVDLPGYGYARESKVKIAAWNELLNDYLRGRPNLRRVFVLVDSRHGLKKNDLTMMADLDMAAVSYQIVLTKIDKLKKGALEKTIAETAAALAKKPAAHPDILATSSEKGDGIDLVRAAIASLVDLSELGYKAS
ncbi:MAG: ribosome biogenesis GTP-binding protein YihA/YsxC [Alphaproteobacteria bacterium]|nr:ribosome biogenesis GTP-binding protein YihA/YsxC [Alphaproteobacteria bacterium]